MDTYSIKRMYFDSQHSTRTIKTGLTLEEAQAHCGDPETSSKTCGPVGDARTRKMGPWFDGYEQE